MNPSRLGRRSVVLYALLALLAGMSAHGIVKVNVSIRDVYGKADIVLIGTVAKADAGGVDVAVKEVSKGAFTAGQFRITFADAADVPAGIAAGGPVVAIAGRANTLVHLADSWRTAGPMAADTTLLQVGLQDARIRGDLATAFPGRTPLLCMLIADMQAGLTLNDDGALVPESSMRVVDGPIEVSISHKGFAYIERVQDLGIQNATSIWTGGLDKVYALPTVWPNDYATLVIANGTAVRVFVPSRGPNNYEEKTADLGLDVVTGVHQVAGGDLNGDGLPDLLLGATVWMQGDGRFSGPMALPQLPADDEWVKATIADATGDGKPDIVVLTKAGDLVTLVNAGGAPKNWARQTRTLWTDGAGPARAVFFDGWLHSGELSAIVVRNGNVVRYACGPTVAGPDDLERLCGTPVARYTGFTPVDTSAASGRGGIPLPPGTAIRPLVDGDVLDCIAVDFNGRRKLIDFLLVTRTPEGFIGGLPLGYRRYGAFMYNRGVVQSLDRRVKEAKTDLPYGTLLATGGTSRGRGQNIVFLKPNGELWQVVVAGG